jgi:hypothetical protein
VFGLAHHHKYSISDIEALVPFERDVYVDLAIAYKKQVEEEMRTRNG